MAAPSGNKNAKGNRGGGRGTARKEREELRWFLRAWTDGEEVAKIVKKMKKGRQLSLREMYVYKAAQGNDSILNKLSDKILPDKLDDDALKGVIVKFDM